MRKFLLLSLLAVTTTAIHAQASKDNLQSDISASAVHKLLANGYLYKDGWLLQVGDTLNLGQGTNPNHSYSFIYESYSNVFGSPDEKRIYLKTGHTNKAIIKRLKLFGNKKIGFTCIAVVSVGLPSRYFVDIENAVTNNEVLEPGQTITTTKDIKINSNDPAIDQIKKWKALLDDNAITQEEYDRKKKELLGR